MKAKSANHNVWRGAVVLVIVLITGWASFASCADEASASARAARLAERFHFFCLESKPDFERLGNQASAMGLQLFEDKAMPMPDGHKFYQRNWMVADPSGQFELTSEDVQGPKKHVIGCGIYAPDADGQELTRALSKDSRLGSPVKRALEDPKTAKIIGWEVKFGIESAQVMLAYDLPDDHPGSVLNLIFSKTHE
jgi:hypothetical protein